LLGKIFDDLVDCGIVYWYDAYMRLELGDEL